MIVAELAIVLDHVDPTLPIILGGSGPRATHVYEIRRNRSRRLDMSHFGVSVSPPSLHLEGGYRAPGWWESECEFLLAGPFLRSVELERRLDAVR